MDTQDFAAPDAPAANPYSLTNGRYRVKISDTGASQSCYDWMALTRWRDDPVQDDLGAILYLRDLDSGEFWSLGYQPTRTPTAHYRTECVDACFRLERENFGIAARLELTVDPDADRERRKLSLANRSAQPRRIEITSYLEVVLFHPDADTAHPAFAKLFVQTERDPATGALLARRRPRANDESWPWLAHALIGAESLQWETDRMAFLDRGRTAASPRALVGGEPLSGTLGNVLDPVLALRTVIALAPGAHADLTFLTGAALDRTAALTLVTDGTDKARTAHPAASGLGLGAIHVATPASTDSGSEELRFFNGHGGFSSDGREYVILLPWEGDGLKRPPLPWINVIANPRFGVLASETGAGYTWSRNSQANRLTPWSNDPVSDPHGEALYLRDESSGAVWSPLPGPCPAPVDYRACHGLGYSSFRCEQAGLIQETTLFVPREDPVRILRLCLTNRGTEPHALSVFSYQRLVMANQPQAESAIVTAYDDRLDILTATNPQAGDFAGGIVFANARVFGIEVEDHAYSADRLAFIGRHRDPSAPAALEPGVRLNGRVGDGLDPCFAHQVRITLAPGESAICVFLLGEVMDATELTALIGRYPDLDAIDAALEDARAFWTDLVSRVQVETPEPAIDLMLNGWLTYQNLGCRIWARSAFYQSGGAFGYRDQLQDAAALVAIRPDLTRAQILLHAAHQFQEGDVLHWWHPEPLERGLRTRFSDDLLWLPFVAAHYIRVTGDAAILDENIPFIVADLLEPGEDERYLQPHPSGENGDLYEHCRRALDRSLTAGAHGLPLMGTGDWNDGMNRVGREGQGESVWMGFFLYRILGDFLPLSEARGDRTSAERYRSYRADLEQALESSGWDGDWYRRAYYDDGTPLGSAQDAECRIDALAQSWSAISGAVPLARAEQAMDALEAHLIDEANGLIRLLAPPFAGTPKDPGYIKGYVAGVRENGGQYTHAACWAVMAMAGLGRRERAARLLAMLSPVSHTSTPETVARYRLEPYAVAADIYGTQPHVGRGGWSWYTGSAGWWSRVALESVLGIEIEGGRTLVVRPCIPSDWPGYRVVYRLPDGVTECEIQVDNGGLGGVIEVWLDGVALALDAGAARVNLPSGAGRYRVQVRLG
ncbi:GH36-type glycosyl hydrolase domain-containing protein [Thiocystis violascens]|uniref:Cellobiose phosphorylase n=1 Tax=Thiocystis violascens (strain ATCC 17096 / DSM 198 / 6111) TaxID=765911 RepID=I3Y725_THIV6|nr:glycosyl transferase [Thiocystis violascens]AFL72793.1 cellobiose phosphorylase [Thiocystis violascens DSM 198]